MKTFKHGLLGLVVSLFASTAFAQAWSVVNDWDKVTTEAGVAWPRNSGLTWAQKYAKWIRGMKKIPREAGGFTFELIDPFGKTMPSPVVDCADTSYMLRVLFSAWYKLPYMFRAGSLSIGHWGVRNVKTGATVGYVSGTLANRTVGGTDHQIASIGGKLGNYLAKLIAMTKHYDGKPMSLNVGHLIIYMLSSAGSGNFAGEQNVYNIKATAIREGDMAIERWQRDGIGHTAVVKLVDPAPAGKLQVELIEGWLPPRQAVWGGPVDAHAHLSDHLFGGDECAEGTGPGCVTYAHFGGGVKRWRVPKYIGGVWTLKVAAADAAVYIPGTNYAALGKRTHEFEALLALPGPEELKAALLRRIGEKRRSLMEKPSGCGARTAREEGFNELYDLMRREWGWSQAQVDAKYRKTIDYVWRTLEYTKSGTCCWNSSTAAMGASVAKQAMDAARAGAAACKAPAVFMKANNRYDPYQAGAGATPWAAYKNDENCAQGSQPSDQLAGDWKATDFCTAKPWLNDATPEVQ